MDWARPGRLVQSRIRDSRVTQFWDKHHLVAQQLRHQLSAASQPPCCRDDEILWDVAALYPPQTQWKTASPAFIDGPVVKAADGIAKRLPESSHKRISQFVTRLPPAYALCFNLTLDFTSDFRIKPPPRRN
jgi:hypothetical protein